MAFSVRSALNDFIQAQLSEREQDGMIHASSLYGCPRRAIYEIRGTEVSDPRDERSERNLFIGSQFHEIVQRALTTSSPDIVEVYHEVPVSVPELDAVGTADTLVRKTDGSWELIELKSINSNGFRYLKGSPKPEHAGQAAFYMLGLREHGAQCENGHEANDPNCDPSWIQGCFQLPPLGDKLTKARVCYLEKDNLLLEEFPVFWSDALEQEVREKAEHLKTYMRDPLSLPPRMEDPKKFPCSWKTGKCQFFTTCWQEDVSEVAPDPDIF